MVQDQGYSVGFIHVTFLPLCLITLFLFAGLGPGTDDWNHIRCNLGFSKDLRTGKGFSRLTEVPQLSPPHLKEEIKSDTNQQKTGQELTSQHSYPALHFQHQVAVTLQGQPAGHRGSGRGIVTWHGVHGNIGLEWNGLLPVSRD